MTCDEALEAISAALDGELGAHERRELDAHMEECPDCAALFDELASYSHALRELDCAAPEDLDGRILSKLPRRRAAYRVWRRLGVAAACFTLALCLGAFVQARRGGSAAGQPAPRAMSGPVLEVADSAEATQGRAAEDEAELDAAFFALDEPRAQYLRCTWRQAPAVQYLATYDELKGYLTLCVEDGAESAAALYGPDYFESAALLAVPYEQEGGGEPAVVEVTTGEDGCSVVLQPAQAPAAGKAAAENAQAPDASSWLILIETAPLPREDSETVEIPLAD